MPQRKQRSKLPQARPKKMVAFKPLVPTTIITSFKGGVGKTAMAVAASERLAIAGLRVLIVSTDPQMDAAKRLGVKPKGQTFIPVPIDSKNGGELEVLCVPTSELINIIYKSEHTKAFDALIIDTAPESRLGALDHIRYWIPIDGRDAAQNTLVLLAHRKETADIVLVPVRRATIENVGALAEELGVEYWPASIKDDGRIANAHDNGVSIWQHVHKDRTARKHFELVNEIASDLWEDVKGNKPFPDPPKMPPSTPSYAPKGWK